jgi:energy-coupling factor transporter ATP-binding protein EcfA2
MELSGRPLLDNELDEALFTGRTAVLDRARRALRQGVNVLLLGPRGSGKTSTLHRLAHEVRRRHEATTVLLDGRGAEDTADLLSVLAWRLGAPDPPRYAASQSERLLARVEAMARHLGEARVTVLLDETPSPQEAQRLFGRLRDDLWRLPLVWAVAADSGDQGVYLSPPADAFFGRTLCLEPMDADTSRGLLRRRAPYLPDRTVTALAEQSLGNPRTLVALARQVLLDGVTAETIAAGEAARTATLETLSEPARRLYDEIVATGAVSMSEPTLLRRLGWTRPRAQQLIAVLEAVGLVEFTREPPSRGRPRKLYRAAAS